jgi:hypothetical protein
MRSEDSTNYESESDESGAPGEAPEEEALVPIVDTPPLRAAPPGGESSMRSEDSTNYESESDESGAPGEAPEEEALVPIVDTPPLRAAPPGRDYSMRAEESTNYESESDESSASGEAREEEVVAPVVNTTPLRASLLSRKSSMRSQGYRSSRSSGFNSSGDTFVAMEEAAAATSIDTARLRASFANRESSMRSQGYQSSNTSGFTESGDTFMAMEEAAHSVTPDDVIVLKSHFGVSQAVVASAHESKSNESDGSIVQEGYSGGSSSGSTSSSGSDSNSDSDSDSNSDSSSESDSSDSSHSTTDSSKDEHESNADLKTQDVVPHDGIPPRIYTSGAQSRVGGPGNRAALLRARSDAALPVAPREETVAAMLATWDEDYDIREGDEDDAPECKSLVGMNASAGLTPIEETGLSDESSQDMSVSEEKPTAMQNDTSTELQYDSSIPIHYGSSTLLDFDYSLRTIDEQSGDVSYDEPSESSPGGELVTTRNGLDPISERFERSGSISTTEGEPMNQSVRTEVQDGSSGLLSSVYSGEHSLDAISEPTHVVFQRDASDASSNGVDSLSEEGGAGERSAEEGSSALFNSGSINQRTKSISTLRSRETLENESSESGSSSDGSYSAYSTESDSSSEESEASSSSNGGTSGTPTPSAPMSSPRQNSLSGALHGPDDSLEWRKSMSKEERDTSDAWVAISRANKTTVPSEVKDSADAAEWAIARSLSALRVASVASSLSGDSSHALPLRDDMSSSSDETVDV